MTAGHRPPYNSEMAFPCAPRGAESGSAVDDAARLVARARNVLANGELAMSARPLLFGEDGVSPQFVASADGCRITDTTGGVFVDWVVGWGTALLGYRRPEVDAAIRAALAAGPTLSLPTALEVEVAERLVRMIPCAEMVAFGKNGSDVVTASVRLARAATERDVVLQYGYHGFQDWFAADSAGVRGIPAAAKGLVHPFRYNDVTGLEALFARHRGRVAAVVMEPFRDELPEDRFLEKVRELTKREGALLVFDEMITGFRVARGGAQELFGVVPDLACFGKALSNGMPLAALCGPRELMRSADSVGVDMGCRGETLSLAAAKAALDVHAAEPIAERVAAIGSEVREGIESAARRNGIPLRLVGHPSRMELRFDDVGRLPAGGALGLFVQGCLDRGVVTNGLVLPTAAHDPAAVGRTISAATEALAVVALAAEGKTSALPPPFGPATIGFLDGAELRAGRVRLAGWILPRGTAPDLVDLIDEDGRRFEALLSRRDDVAAAHPGIAGAERSGFSLDAPAGPIERGATFTLRAFRDGRLLFRCRLVAGIRAGARSMPRQLFDGHVVEF